MSADQSFQPRSSSSGSHGQTARENPSPHAHPECQETISHSCSPWSSCGQFPRMSRMRVSGGYASGHPRPVALHAVVVGPGSTRRRASRRNYATQAQLSTKHCKKVLYPQPAASAVKYPSSCCSKTSLHVKLNEKWNVGFVDFSRVDLLFVVKNFLFLVCFVVQPSKVFQYHDQPSVCEACNSLSL